MCHALEIRLGFMPIHHSVQGMYLSTLLHTGKCMYALHMYTRTYVHTQHNTLPGNTVEILAASVRFSNKTNFTKLTTATINYNNKDNVH